MELEVDGVVALVNQLLVVSRYMPLRGFVLV